MPLVVPALRLAYVFLNVFETFKTLRLLPSSARNSGQPSARAMSQRKRAMKGCMTVWLVWVCFTLYERWVETFVWLFVPFYSEIKALFILFFLLTRSKGAEPVFLHVIRPVLKPYTVPLDALFDALTSIGDLMVLVASIPFNFVRDHYRRWTSALDPPQADVQTWHRDESRTDVRPSAHRAYVSESNGNPQPAVTRDVSTGSSKQTRSVIHTSSSSTPTQKIWHPPASAYADDIALNPHSGLPTPPIERQQRPEGSGEWRQYPPFTSSSGGASFGEPLIVAPRPVRAGNAAHFAGIVEDDEDGRAQETRQDFRQSLLLPREPRNPGFDGDLSDEIQMKGVEDTQQTQTRQIHGNRINTSDTEMSVDEADARDRDQDPDDSDMDADEDMFNTTLRTPSKRRRYRGEEDDDSDYLDDLMLTPPRMKIAFSVDSAASRSTALSTTDIGSSLRTRTNSVASTNLSSVLDSPAVAAKKRRLTPHYAGDDVEFSVNIPVSKSPVARKLAVSPARGSSSTRSSTIGRQRGRVFKTAAESTVDDAVEDEDVPSDTSSGAKRKRTPVGRAARPKPQRADTQGTIRAPITGVKGPATTRPTVTRLPSVRGAAARKERPPLPSKKSSAGATSTSIERKQAIGAAAQKTK